MGMHIIPYILKERVEPNDYGYSPWDIEEFKNFDSCRYSGDRDFVLTDDIDWNYESDDPLSTDMYEYSYMRPKDIDEAIEWVVENVEHEPNHARLINLLEAMRLNKKLHIFVSW